MFYCIPPPLVSAVLLDILLYKYTWTILQTLIRTQENCKPTRRAHNSRFGVCVISTLYFIIIQPLTNAEGGSIWLFWQQEIPSFVLLTKFHEQGQEDPQRDLKGLPDVLVVEGKDWESLFVSSRVSLIMGIPACLSGWTPPRLVVFRNNITTRRGDRDENEQQNAH